MIARLIRHFRADLWEAGRAALAPEIPHPDLVFRRSLGVDERGIDGFPAYLNQIRAALDGDRRDIVEPIAEADRAAAHTRFHGRRRADPLGAPATGRRIAWAGAAFVALRDARLAEIWVLGDTDGLRKDLASAP